MGKSDLWDLAGLPGVPGDRQSAEGFVLETHVFSKLISQNGRKCPHSQCLSLLQLRVTKESPPSTLLENLGPWWSHLAMKVSEVATSMRSLCPVGAEHRTGPWEDKVTHTCSKSAVHGPQDTRGL